MKIKKLLAGVTAAALTATSLAVVNVSAADKTSTHSFMQNYNNITFTYENELVARSNVDLTALFSVDTEKTYEFSLSIDHVDVSGLPSGDQWIGGWVQGNPLCTLSYVGDTIIKITGKNKDTNAVETVTTKAKKNNSGNMEFRAVGANSDVKFLEENDLDIGRFKVITKVAITQNFKTANLFYSVPEGKIKFVFNGKGEGTTADDAGLAELFARNVNVGTYKNNTFSGGGFKAKFDTVYGLEDITTIYAGTESQTIDTNLLRWVNDNIGSAKGAKIRFTFGTPQSTSADGLGWLDNWKYPTAGDKRPWYVGGGTESSAKANDMVLAVNGHSSNLLRQEVVMTKSGNDYVAEFDWDTVMKASPTTVGGHVTSIAFALNGGDLTVDVPKGDNYDNIAFDANKSTDYAVLKQIEVIVPEGQQTPSDNEWEKTVVTVTDENSGVGAMLTNKALTGNGGTIIKATGTLTTNKLTYEVKLLDKNGKYVQPAGEVTLTLPIPQDMQGRDIKKVTHYKTDGTSEQLDVINASTYKTDKYVKIVTTSFSGFEIEFEGTEAPATEPATEAPATEPATEAPATEAPATSDVSGNVSGNTGDKNIPTGFAIAIVPAALAAAAAVVAKKRK